VVPTSLANVRCDPAQRTCGALLDRLRPFTRQGQRGKAAPRAAAHAAFPGKAYRRALTAPSSRLSLPAPLLAGGASKVWPCLLRACVNREGLVVHPAQVGKRKLLVEARH
jgi:hypothetical protein